MFHKFSGAPDGLGPEFNALARDAAGNLYGTTLAGGSGNPSVCNSYWNTTSGCGMVFKVSASGKYHIIYKFKGRPDGYGPYGVTLDARGNLYGVTQLGGANDIGTVFKISNTGKESVLYSFTGGSDDGQPFASVVRDDAGNLYVTTTGPNCYSSGNCGTVFKLDTQHHLTVLYTFHLIVGYIPQSVIRDASGTFYGETQEGGSFYSGTIWKLTKAGAFSTLHNFTGSSDGNVPTGAVLRDGKGNLYGTAWGGGNGAGTVWEVDNTGNFSVLYAFPNSGSLSHPNANVVLDASGELYSSIEYGGLCGVCGGAFELSPGAR